jgi:small-conductance mechanosensitive channel
MALREVERYVRQGVTEFLGVVRAIAMVVIFIVLVTSFVEQSGIITQGLSLFASVNVVSATLAVMFAPLLRSFTGGLTILADRFVKTGQAVELPGVAPLGRVVSVKLRETRIKSFEDGAMLHVPNILFLRHPIVNGSLRGPDASTTTGVTKIVVRFPVQYDTDVPALRNLIFTIVPPDVSCVLDEDLVLRFQKNDIPIADVDTERTKLMLDMMTIIHKSKIELRF